MVKFIGKAIVIMTLTLLTACGMQNVNTENETPLSADEQNWRQYGVNDPRMLDWTDMHNNTRMEVSRSLIRVVEQLDRVDDAIVIRTDHNAYVGVRTTEPYGSGGFELSNAMRSRIILAVKTADSRIFNVYISGTPGMYDAMRNYAAKLQNGVPDRNLVQSFNTRMQRFFPFSELGQ